MSAMTGRDFETYSVQRNHPEVGTSASETRPWVVSDSEQLIKVHGWKSVQEVNVELSFHPSRVWDTTNSG